MITFRLFDSLPGEHLVTWKAGLAQMPPHKAHAELRRRIEESLDRGHKAALCCGIAGQLRR